MSTPSPLASKQLGLIPHLTWVEAKGADARAFLQGQFTGDIRPLKHFDALFTAYCQAQGRALATLWVICLTEKTAESPEESFALVMSAELAPTITARLQKFIMRSKVHLRSIENAGVVGLAPAPVANATDMATSPITPINPALHFSVMPHTSYAIAVTEEINSLGAMPSIPSETWFFHDVIDARVWIFPATSEAWVPSMIGLEKNGGIGYQKGCYPGQEVIARLHYKGGQKRSLYRFTVEEKSLSGKSGLHIPIGSTIHNDTQEVGQALILAHSAEKTVGLACLIDSLATTTLSINTPMGNSAIRAEPCLLV